MLRCSFANLRSNHAEAPIVTTPDSTQNRASDETSTKDSNENFDKEIHKSTWETSENNLGEQMSKGQFELNNVTNMPVDFSSFMIPPEYKEKFAYDIPYDIKGSGAIKKFHPKSFIQQILSHQRPEDLDFPSIFHKFYDDFLQALESSNEDFIQKHCEKRLSDKCIKALRDLKKSDLKVLN